MSFTEPNKAKTYLRSYLQGRRMFKALEAMEICLHYHNGTRKDGVTPEWFHQISIVLYLSTLEHCFGDDAEAIYIVAFLHDVVEDYDYPLESIKAIFGEKIMRSVAAISKKHPGTPKKSTADYYDAIAKDKLASVVKGADRTHNFQSMPGVFTPEKQAAYIAEAKDYILPMLKKARKTYFAFRPAYENIKHMLMMQMTLIENTLEALA